MPDIELKCLQCQNTFSFSEKEQEEFYRRNLPQPQRCQSCRSTRKKAVQAAADGTAAAATPNRYEIVCDRCGKKDFVPFAPKLGRPVSCSQCFNTSRSRTRYA